ncbi:hypothetical protein BX666DRAFT_250665 [Dichotomocladium elegans]|nr:hypothetical protein BX666DRAFT_250665 [Dichotomocladium elegans]
MTPYLPFFSPFGVVLTYSVCSAAAFAAFFFFFSAFSEVAACCFCASSFANDTIQSSCLLLERLTFSETVLTLACLAWNFANLARRLASFFASFLAFLAAAAAAASASDGAGGGFWT